LIRFRALARRLRVRDDASMKNFQEGETATVYPVVGWQAVFDEEPVCLMLVGYARNSKDAAAARAGKRTPCIPLGFTAAQCRKFAADLIEAANHIDGGKVNA
jgi:hypothetical protein